MSKIRRGRRPADDHAVLVFIDTDHEPDLDGTTVRVNLNVGPQFGYNRAANEELARIHTRDNS